MTFNEGGADCPPRPDAVSKCLSKSLLPSMKGGRTAPRDIMFVLSLVECGSSFNEGGADCPPRQPGFQSVLNTGGSFNEGGADCPPRPVRLYSEEARS